MRRPPLCLRDGQTRPSERFRCTSAQAPQAELQAAQYNVAEVPIDAGQ
jgi:hypothetical protein